MDSNSISNFQTPNSKSNWDLVIGHWSLKPGFTIIEFISAFAIIGLVAVLVASIYFAHFRLFSNQNTAIEVSSQNKIALDEITNQIRESETIVSTCTGCGMDTTSDTIIILQLWPLNASGEPIDPGGNYDFIVYKRDASDNSKLAKKIVATAPPSSRESSTKTIATNISDLKFIYDNPDPTLATEVTISVTTTAISGSKTHTMAQSAKAVLRNK